MIYNMRYFSHICEEKNPKNRNLHFFIFWQHMDFDPPGGVVMNYQNQKKYGSKVILVRRIRIWGQKSKIRKWLIPIPAVFTITLKCKFNFLKYNIMHFTFSLFAKMPKDKLNSFNLYGYRLYTFHFSNQSYLCKPFIYQKISCILYNLFDCTFHVRILSYFLNWLNQSMCSEGLGAPR
jgi:hypothetical protein